ncbi:MAG: hypothetical protein M3450_13950 [Actinomycetota bacterium]|nr:hypothetical protein [Actinomycetota bacterium]
MVGTAVVVHAGLTVFFPAEGRLTYTPPGPVRRVDLDAEAGRVHVVAGAGNIRITSR